MTKVEEVKYSQGYLEESDRCGNCAHFTSDKSTIDNGYGPYTTEKKLRCSVGGFKIKKNGGCKCHKRTKEETE